MASGWKRRATASTPVSPARAPLSTRGTQGRVYSASQLGQPEEEGQRGERPAGRAHGVPAARRPGDRGGGRAECAAREVGRHVGGGDAAGVLGAERVDVALAE